MTLQEELSKIETDSDLESMDFDVAVIGAGPAGMSAALCAARARLNVVIFDKNLPGGQAATAYKISNYLGFPNGILGSDLALEMENHLNDYNIVYKCESVEDIVDVSSKIKCVKTDLGNDYRVRGVILSLGLEPKPLEMTFEKTFLGRGISYYAQSDVEKYAGQDVAVIGGGNCACYAADYLSQFVNKLYLIHHSDFIKSVKNLKKKIMENPKIDILWNTKLIDAFGLDSIEKIKLENNITHQQTWIDVKGVFIYVGRIPPKQILRIDLNLDESGFIVTDDYMRTNIAGIYAAGDIRSKQIRQIATAVADGMIAAINLDKDLF